MSVYRRKIPPSLSPYEAKLCSSKKIPGWESGVLIEFMVHNSALRHWGPKSRTGCDGSNLELYGHTVCSAGSRDSFIWATIFGRLFENSIDCEF